jgi:hypothetical protein
MKLIKLIFLVLPLIFLSGCQPNSSSNSPPTVDLVPTKILPSGLPDKHQISTFFVPQAPEKNWDQPWQDACEEASLLTVNYYYQNLSPDLNTILTDYQRIFDFEATQGWTHDINLTQMASVSADLFDLSPQILDNPTIDQIKEYLLKDIPVIITANGKTLYSENKHFKNGGPWYHSLVILGFDDNKKQFIVHDVGTQFGAYFHYSYATLLESIHDFPTSNKKEEIDKGDKKVLVLLK